MSESAFERGQSLGYLVNLLGRLLARALNARLSEHGVAIGQFPVLLMLWEEDGLTQSEIARRLDIEQPTVANTLKRMERDGLVVAAPDPDHARRVLFRLTPRGRDLEATLKREAQQVNAYAARGLSAEDLASFRATLRRLIAAYP